MIEDSQVLVVSLYPIVAHTCGELPSNVMLVRAVQPLNAPSPMLATC